MQVTGNNLLNTYRLSIRLFSDGFSLSILHTADNSLVQKEDVTADGKTPLYQLLEQVLKRPHLTEYTFQRVELLVLSPSTCVPLEYFRREEVFPLYNLTFPSLKVSKAEVHYQILPSLEVVELFSLNNHIQETIQAIYPDVEIISLEGRAIETIANADRKRQDPGIHFYAMIAPKNMLVCCFREQRLHFATTYNVDNDSDRLYYIMGVWKNMQMDEKTQALYLNNASTELLNQAKRFIPQTTVCEL
ncbi:MAG: DUF3822 family protein [Bacteroidaceae bacterium]|nr:DUF3822 family protein [Bacteroidaceae bacterium]